MRITNTNTVFTGLKYAEHMTVNTTMPCMYNISLNVQYQIESVLSLEVISDKR